MATTINPIDTQIAGLAQTFQTAIKATITAESIPLTKIQTQRDTIDVRRGIYTDIKTNFDGLQSALQALISSQGSYGLGLTSKATVTPATSGTTVLTGSNTESTPAGEYDIAVTQLAKAQTKSTTLAYSPEVALGKSGTFWLGGSGTAAVQTKTTQGVVFTDGAASDSVTAAATATVTSGQSELSTGAYTLETQFVDGVHQFRLLNGSTPVSIRNGTGFNSEWQTMTDGSFDTGRGLSLTLKTSDVSTSTALTYTANYSDYIASDSVTAGGTTTVATGQRELGAGNYALETRDSGGVVQFRMVNADGNAVSIRNQSGSSYTSAWQDMTSGSYDTGRGLNLTLSTTGTTASTALTYTAAGTSINISSTDTLRTITAAINAANQPDGRDFRASIVANKLVLTGIQSGENHSMLYKLMKSDVENDFIGFSAELQAAQNAKFTVNGLPVSRMINTGLSDVVDGATISLASDAEGKSAQLSISTGSANAAALMNAMVTSFNTTLTHLKSKLATTSATGTDGKVTYTRGPLSGDLGLSGLRQELMSLMNSNITNSGSFKNLEEIGLSFDKNNQLTLDSTKFSAALKNNRTDVTALLDKGLGEINTVVAGYTGTKGTLSSTLTSIEEQRTNYDNRITKFNASIITRKQFLYNQYLNYQTQIADYGKTAEWFGILYGTTNKSG